MVPLLVTLTGVIVTGHGHCSNPTPSGSPGYGHWCVTGAAGLTAPLAVTSQFIQDHQWEVCSILTLQGHIDLLAAVLLQNRWGLDLLIAERSGLGLFLREECCFYVNQSGTVKSKITKPQTSLKSKQQLTASVPGIPDNPKMELDAASF